jgi:hypothetical protein
VSLTLNPPVRVAALVGLLVATGLAAFVFLVGRGASGTEPSGAPTSATKASTRPATQTKAASTPATPKPRAYVSKSGFPAAVDRALRRNRVVVVAVYMPRAGVDAVVRAEARAAAVKAHAGYVAVSALNERVVRALVARTGVLPDPAVVIVKRPGVVTATFSVTDRETVTQAVYEARR